MKDHPIGHKKWSQDRWSLVTGSITLKCGTFCQEYLLFQDRWSFKAVVSQDRFYCICVQSFSSCMWLFLHHICCVLFLPTSRQSSVSRLPLPCETGFLQNVFLHSADVYILLCYSWCMHNDNYVSMYACLVVFSFSCL